MPCEVGGYLAGLSSDYVLLRAAGNYLPGSDPAVVSR